MLRLNDRRYSGATARLLLWATAGVAPAGLHAQTDFYNLDHERPLRVEDAYVAATRAFEIQASPIAFSQERAGPLVYSPGIELKHGIFPGLEVSVAIEAENARIGQESTTELDDVELSGLLNLWVEGPRLPAVALRATGNVPTDSDRSAALDAALVLTRTLGGPVRAHLNGGTSFGEGRTEDWWAGAALDLVLPFQGMVLLGETWVSSPEVGDERVHSGAGVRIQMTPTLVADAGIGRDWSGDVRSDWTLTVGLSYEFGVRALMPGVDR